MQEGDRARRDGAIGLQCDPVVVGRRGRGQNEKKNPAHSPERKEEGPASTWAADGGAGSRRAVGLVSVACGNEEGGQLPDN